VSIDFNFTDDNLTLVYKENGQGFDRLAPPTEQDKKSFGLKSIESRMAFLNGQLDFQTAPGQGVQVRLSFPL